jgi:hypothetical protein
MTCGAQRELSTELLGKLRQGEQLTVAFVNLQGQIFALQGTRRRQCYRLANLV